MMDQDVPFRPEVQIVERIQDLILALNGFVETLIVDVPILQATEEKKFTNVPASLFAELVVGVKAPPQQQVSQRIVEQIVAIRVPQLWERIVAVTQPVLQKHIQARVGEQMVDVLMPPIREVIVESCQLVPLERSLERDVVEQLADILVPQNKEEIAGETQLVPPDRSQERVREQIADMPVDSPHASFMEEIVDGVQFAGVPVPQIQEQFVEGFKVLPQRRGGYSRLLPLERIQERVAAQNVDSPVCYHGVGVQPVSLERIQEQGAGQFVNYHVLRHGEIVETIQLVPLERMQELVPTCTAAQIVEVAGPSRKSWRRSWKNLQVKFATAEHALPAPVASPLWDQVDMTLLIGMVTDTEGDLATASSMRLFAAPPTRRHHNAITLEFLQHQLETAVAPAYDWVMLHTDRAPCL